MGGTGCYNHSDHGVGRCVRRSFWRVGNHKTMNFEKTHGCHGIRNEVMLWEAVECAELMNKFPIETSSLPTDWSPSNRLHMALWGRFCSGKAEAMVLSAPLPPPARFLLWVRLWVMGEWPQPIGENKGAALPHGLTQISLHLFLCKRSTIPPAPIYCPHSIPKPVFFLTDCLLTAPRNTSGPTQILRRCKQKSRKTLPAFR